MIRWLRALFIRPRPFPYEHSRWVVTDSRDAMGYFHRSVR